MKCHIKFEILAPINKSKMANKLRSTNLERFIRRLNSPLTRL